MPETWQPEHSHWENEPDPRGTAFAVVGVKSGATASQALHERFETIRCAELERLKKKLGSLTADVVQALARGPQQALAGNAPSLTIEAVVGLFALEA